jgi:hypothetical protein
VNRFSTGDAYCLTFSDLDRGMAATERLEREWDLFDRRERAGCPIVAALHKGSLKLFRSYLFSDDVAVAFRVARAAVHNLAGTDASILVTGKVQRELMGTLWGARLQIVDIGRNSRRLAGIEIYHLDRLGD